MDIKIEPSIISGEVRIPASKSYSHRAVMVAALANGSSVIKNLQISEDIQTTMDIVGKFGAKMSWDGDDLVIEGNGGKICVQENEIQCNESGSSIRFLIPLALTSENRKGKISFHGRGKLGERPLDTYYRIFDEQGIKYRNNSGKLPLIIESGRLKGGDFCVDGDVSSQFITGLLYSLPLLKENSEIIINKKLESRGYVDLTLKILDLAGIKIRNNDYKSFGIEGKQEYKPINYTVEGDYSQGAFWIVAGILSKNKDKVIRCVNLYENSLQGDKAIIEIAQKMGANIEIGENELIVKAGETQGMEIDVSQCPDLAPILTVLAVFSKGSTKILNGARLRIKESDRITSMVTELAKMGAKIREVGDEIHVEGVDELAGDVVLDCWNDHRVAMALAVASTRCKKAIRLRGAECVKKSYPNFWEEFSKHGCKLWKEF